MVRSPSGDRTRPSARRRLLLDQLARVLLICGAVFLVGLLAAVYVFVGSKALRVFANVTPWHFLFASHWTPLAAPGQQDYGAGGLILGSIIVVAMAIFIATPLSVGAALFLEQTDRQLGERLLRPVIEVFVGIPSVVYGWIGLTTLVPFIRQHTASPTGLSILAAGLVLSVMIIPTVTSLSADAVRRVPDAMAEASYALGATRWQTIYRVVLPAARAGITTGIVLGMARALGEALAVAMVIGGVPNFPSNFLGPAATMTTAIALDLANGALNPVLNNALYTLGLVLLLMSLAMILLIRRLSDRFEIR
ncbi:MAG TPA: phosphate ABC transporter permease subunit PstC [Candidatus Dormibacteraeota bacterium]|nr:phosphate ABC transporter permease subunit PstC [Candidatus Dormibacteraeota bacterium]